MLLIKPQQIQIGYFFVAPELNKLRKKFNVFHETTIFEDEEEKITDSEMTRSYDFTNITEADYPTIAMQIGIRPKYVPMLLKSFFSEASINLANLEDAVSIKDYAAIERYVHSIKGSAGNMKFNIVYDIFKSLEEAARLNDESFNYAKVLVPFREWISNHEEEE
ncbi:MAG: hypothetical protein B7X72_12890 [Sphingobacteriia bacterium 39-39-8]|nr:MAG: hypothetical protein B7X72_12890 [Sphingobacteriia bacterium 39-39-8]